MRNMPLNKKLLLYGGLIILEFIAIVIINNFHRFSFKEGRVLRIINFLIFLSIIMPYIIKRFRKK